MIVCNSRMLGSLRLGDALERYGESRRLAKSNGRRFEGGPWRSYPPTQTWRTFLRNQAFAIGTTDLGEAGRLSDALLALVRGWIARVVGCVTKVREASPAGLSSHRTDCRHIALPIVPIGAPFTVVACRSPPWPTALGAGNWSMAARRLSPYRSRASPRRKLPAFTNFARPSLSRRRAKPIGCTARLP
jgi:hypothetical protein